MLIKRTNTNKKWKTIKHYSSNNNMLYGLIIDFNTVLDDDEYIRKSGEELGKNNKISKIIVENFDSNNISHVRRHSKLFPYNLYKCVISDVNEITDDIKYKCLFEVQKSEKCYINLRNVAYLYKEFNIFNIMPLLDEANYIRVRTVEDCKALSEIVADSTCNILLKNNIFYIQNIDRSVLEQFYEFSLQYFSLFDQQVAFVPINKDTRWSLENNKNEIINELACVFHDRMQKVREESILSDYIYRVGGEFFTTICILHINEFCLTEFMRLVDNDVGRHIRKLDFVYFVLEKCKNYKILIKHLLFLQKKKLGKYNENVDKLLKVVYTKNIIENFALVDTALQKEFFR